MKTIKGLRLQMASLLAATVASALSAAPALSVTAEEILTYAGPDREQVLLEGAKKEGEVVLYSAMIVNQALRPIAEAFMQKYPDIQLTYWRGDSEEITQRVLAEVRAGNVVGDVVEGTSLGEALVKAGVVQTYTTPKVEAYPEKYRDPEGQWTATRLSYFAVAYNTNLVSPDEVPKTYEDLLDPKWKGKMAWRIGSESGTPLFLTNLRTAWGEERANEYFQKLKEQEIVNFGSGSARTLVDRVIAGEYAIALNIFAHHPLISAEKGAPVNTQLLEPVPTTTATMLIPKGAPHPFAAMLLIDFILSEEGQKILLGADYIPAHPDVPPAEMLNPIVPRLAGVEENFVNPEMLIGNSERSEQIYQELFR